MAHSQRSTMRHVHEPTLVEPRHVEYVPVLAPAIYRCATCGSQLLGVEEQEEQR